MTGDIERVLIAGGGIVAWSAAAALKRRLPVIDVSVIASAPPADALADRVVNTLPSIIDFHADIGLSDEDTIVRAQSDFRLGTRFSGWAEGSVDYVHAYGSYGEGLPGVPFHQLWMRAGDHQTFDSYSLAAELGKVDRFAIRGTSEASIGYALRLTTDRYRELLRAYALHLGAAEQTGEVADLELREDGFAAAVILADGQRASADLFVDCTGPTAAMRSRVDDERESWSRWLLCDRVRITDSARDLSLLDDVTPTSVGWQSTSAQAFASSHTDDGESAIPISQGRLKNPWIRNCVAIGDAAVSVEPLEWTNLHLAHSQIDRLISMIPGKDCAPVELAEYNRQCNAEADRIRDFVCMHYVTARRQEPFWQEAASVELPSTLAHSLSLFAERGRLPYYEEETFTRDSWLAVLIGQGFLPRRIDPLAECASSAQVEQTLARCRQSIETFVAAQPSYREFKSRMGNHAHA